MNIQNGGFQILLLPTLQGAMVSYVNRAIKPSAQKNMALMEPDAPDFIEENFEQDTARLESEMRSVLFLVYSWENVIVPRSVLKCL